MAALISFLIIFLIFLLLLLHANSLSFNFTSFQSNNISRIDFEGDAFQSGSVLQLTKNQADGNLTSSTGWATYSKPVPLWDAKTGRLTDFTTHFTFTIRGSVVDPESSGDGVSFFIAPYDSKLPVNSSGGYLALFSPETAMNNDSSNHIVAVEFDSYKNDWDPSSDHVGINVNSIVSAANVSLENSIKNGSKAYAWVNYNSTSKNLSVFLTFSDNPVYNNGDSILSYTVDLREILPEQVKIGFSASTGVWVETHSIPSWSFDSTLEIIDDRKGRSSLWLIVGLAIGIAVLICGLCVILFIFWRKRAGGNKEQEAFDDDMDDEFEKGTGPKRFTCRELCRATNNFSEGGKLGEGGFGGVYKGLLGDQTTKIAVKRISRGSKQGKKEYMSEVRTISRLRHRNLVQLIGWCHEQGDLLLVYEFMANRSLDSHLFKGKVMLTCSARYKIALGLASALLYLHEEWEQCVVHRDIKSSNVMLDSNFNAKLGDFGLARLVDHELGSQTTVLAGTLGYLAPECVMTSKASKESDVYSFGVVALEIACGRRPVEPKQEPSKVMLVEWVWDLYGEGQLLEAVDHRLGREFDERKMECLMVVGLWCCHPDFTIRPSIRQAINVLNFEAPLPSLPSKLPVPMYGAPPMNLGQFTYKTETSNGSCPTYSSISAVSSKMF